MGRSSEDLADRLWPDDLQEIQDALTRSHSLPVLVVETSGRPLAVCEDLSLFCRWFTRRVSLFRPCLMCGRSDPLHDSPNASVRSLRQRAQIHACPLGLTDVAVPIWSAGHTIGLLLSCQAVLDEPSGRPPDQTGDPAECLALLSRAPRASHHQLLRLADGLSAAAWLLGAFASGRRRNARLTERLRSQTSLLRDLTVTDAVTGLANRCRFLEVLRAEILRANRYRRRLSLAVLEIEDASRIYDEFGQAVGDAALSSVADCLQSTLRQTDFIARVAGNAFAVTFPETARHQAMIAAARVNAAVDDLNASGELPVEVRLAVGLTDTITDTEDMLSEASRAAARARGGQTALI